MIVALPKGMSSREPFKQVNAFQGDPRFRRASTRDEIEAVLRLRRAIYVDVEGLSPKLIRDEVFEDEEHLLVYEKGEAVAAVSLLLRDPVLAEVPGIVGPVSRIGKLVVLPPYRHSWFAFCLMALSLELGIAGGANVIGLLLRMDNRALARKYEGLGFRPLDVTVRSGGVEKSVHCATGPWSEFLFRHRRRLALFYGPRLQGVKLDDLPIAPALSDV